MYACVIGEHLPAALSRFIDITVGYDTTCKATEVFQLLPTRASRNVGDHNGISDTSVRGSKPVMTVSDLQRQKRVGLPSPWHG